MIFELQQKQVQEPRSKQNEDQRQRQRNPRCNNCGNTSHQKFDCPHKSEGPTCFGCNQFGHRSMDPTCPMKSKNYTPHMNILRCLTIDSKIPIRRSWINIEINGCQIRALVDTGSDLTIMQGKMYGMMELKPYEIFKKELNGIGEENSTLGYIIQELWIDGQMFNEVIFIMEDNKYFPEMIIGQMLLNHTELNISKDKISIWKINDTTTISQQIRASMISTENAFSLIFHNLANHWNSFLLKNNLRKKRTFLIEGTIGAGKTTLTD